MKQTIKIEFDKDKLPKLKDLIKCWKQLTVISETDNSITIKGYDHVIESMLLNIGNYSERHNGKHKIKYENPLKFGFCFRCGEHGILDNRNLCSECQKEIDNEV